MKYFIDTEFIEGFHKPLFGKRRHFIDLISIGIVCEDGREYYAISNQYWYYKADNWVKKNVIIPLYLQTVHGDNRNRYDAQNFHYAYGISNRTIAKEILEFMGCWRDQHFWRTGEDVPEIYGYYSDYDWVLFCSLFGRMIDLPEGFPMYCRDLKQMLDEHVMRDDLFGAASDDLPFSEKIKLVKSWEGFPPQENEHNALADAKWNFELYKFLTQPLH